MIWPSTAICLASEIPGKTPIGIAPSSSADIAPRKARVWLNFKAINYRADVWLNGVQIADREHFVGSFSRYRFDVTRPPVPARTAWP